MLPHSVNASAVEDVSPRPARADHRQKNDLVVYGATPGGVACAVRAAREGLTVQLVSHSDHMGGMFTNGLSTMDTLYNGSRAPIYDELRHRIHEFYREEYGPNSSQFQATQPGHPKTRYEAHVVEQLIDQLLIKETRITVLKKYYPVAVRRKSSLLQSVVFQQMDGSQKHVSSADAFVDCSYEADLAAVAGIPLRVERESRHEFDEEHAGVVFMRSKPWPPQNVNAPRLALSRRLNLFRYEEWFEKISESSTGAADPAVQGFNMRTIITSDPGNRVLVEKPAGYDPKLFQQFGAGNPQRPGLSMPNQKFGMNEPKLVGEQDRDVEGNWETRRAVTKKHCNATLGLLYYRQTDPSVPLELRRQWQTYGLPKDEFADNRHLPYQIYARETRRIKGRSVFTENDAQLAPKLQRAPVHSDSISITEWFLDSHACTNRRIPGSELEGMVMLKNQTFPGQVAYRTILPQNIKNLLVPVCLSATHIGWGTIRLEPTWMSISEAAAFAVVMSKRQGVTPNEIDGQELVRQLTAKRFMVSFFNDVEGHEEAEWYPAVQYLGTQGYFGSYDARPGQLLTTQLADVWVERFRRQMRGENEKPTAVALRCLAAEQIQGEPLMARELARRLGTKMSNANQGQDQVLEQMTRLKILPDEPITRGDACRLIVASKNL